MKIRVKSFATFRDILPRELEMEVPAGSTVGVLIDTLVRQYPLLEDLLFRTPHLLRESVVILRNGRNISFTGGPATPLGEGDLVAIFPPLGGG